MHAEQHLVFSPFALTETVMDVTITPSCTQIWTRSSHFYRLAKWLATTVITCFWLDYEHAVLN